MKLLKINPILDHCQRVQGAHCGESLDRGRLTAADLLRSSSE